MSEILEAEHHIALNDVNVRERSMELGPLGKITCRECHGAMVRIEEESIIRFRCRTGHAYSIRSLMANVNETAPVEKWIYWDVGFLLWGALMLIIGWWLLRAGKQETATLAGVQQRD